MPVAKRIHLYILHEVRHGFLPQVLEWPSYPLFMFPGSPQCHTAHFKGSNMCIVGEKQKSIMPMYFLEQYVLFSVFASQYHMRMMDVEFVVYPRPSLAHDFIGESGVQNPTMCVMPDMNLHPPNDHLVPEKVWGTHQIILGLQYHDFDLGIGRASKVCSILINKILISKYLLFLQIQKLFRSMGHHAMLHPAYLWLHHHIRWLLLIFVDSSHLTKYMRTHNKIPLMIRLIYHIMIHPIALLPDPTLQKNLFNLARYVQ